MNESATFKGKELPTGGIKTQMALDSKYETRSSYTSSYTRDSSTLRRQVKDLTEDTQEVHRNAIRTELDDRAQRWGRESIQQLLSFLRTKGFAWRDVARIVGVSVPALQKWRKGSTPSGPNRLKIARLVAVTEYVENEYLINDVASWLEMPIQTGVHVNALDFLAQNQEILVVELASEQASPEKVLDEFEPEWREQLVDNAFEVFTASDGSKAIRRRT